MSYRVYYSHGVEDTDAIGIRHMLSIIRKRPGMFLSPKTLASLQTFIWGYQFSEKDLNVHRHGNFFPLDFSYMHEFTSIYLKKERNSMGYCSQIRKVCNNDEDKALDLFFEIYDAFCQVQMKRYWKASLTEAQIHRNNIMLRKNGSEPSFKDPIAVYVLELTVPAYILAIETMEDVRMEPFFFASPEDAKGHGEPLIMGAESYFGPIDAWEEFKADNLYFDKDIERS